MTAEKGLPPPVTHVYRLPLYGCVKDNAAVIPKYIFLKSAADAEFYVATIAKYVSSSRTELFLWIPTEQERYCLKRACAKFDRLVGTGNVTELELECF